MSTTAAPIILPYPSNTKKKTTSGTEKTTSGTEKTTSGTSKKEKTTGGTSGTSGTSGKGSSSHPWYDDPLPYISCLAILFLVFLGLLTWCLGLNYKATQCIGNPNIWCSDNWVCGISNCGEGSACFSQVGSTGLSSCIFGPNASGATACMGVPSTTGGVSCECPNPLNMTKNCFSGCGINLSGITGMTGATACCGCYDCSSGKCPEGTFPCPPGVVPCPPPPTT